MATFTPIGPTTVAPRKNVQFEVTVAVESLAGFDAANIVIGSNGATDLTFEYSPAWRTAFANVNPIVHDAGFYAQDVFVGGNRASGVGSSLSLGVVTLVTNQMPEGDYDVRIDRDLIPDVLSTLIFEGVHEGLSGSAEFHIRCPVADADCDNDVDLADFAAFSNCMLGPGQLPPTSCGRFDADGDRDVDLRDTAAIQRDFTGEQ
jgi:hypothetical protein